MVESRAISRYVRISPRRAREVIGLIRGKTAEEALNILSFTPKKSASCTLKVLRSAISNATNKDKEVKAEDLVVKNAYIGQGPTLKRYNSRAMGRVNMIRRRTSHICIELSGKS
jgi:large subunit ribosomal protein L22